MNIVDKVRSTDYFYYKKRKELCDKYPKNSQFIISSLAIFSTKLLYFNIHDEKMTIDQNINKLKYFVDKLDNFLLKKHDEIIYQNLSDDEYNKLRIEKHMESFDSYADIISSKYGEYPHKKKEIDNIKKFLSAFLTERRKYITNFNKFDDALTDFYFRSGDKFHEDFFKMINKL